MYKVIKTKTTMNHNEFFTNKYQPTNRNKASEVLRNSLQESGGNALIPVIVDADTNQLIDGHRRWEALMTLGLPLTYTLVETDDVIKLMIMLNSTGNPWTLRMFINHHAKAKEEYFQLEEYLEVDNVTVDLIKLFNNITVARMKAGSKLNIDYELMDEALEAIAYIKNLTRTSVALVTKAVYRSYKAHDDFSFSKLVDRMEKKREKGHYKNLIVTGEIERLKVLIDTAYRSRV